MHYWFLQKKIGIFKHYVSLLNSGQYLDKGCLKLASLYMKTMSKLYMKTMSKQAANTGFDLKASCIEVKTVFHWRAGETSKSH